MNNRDKLQEIKDAVEALQETSSNLGEVFRFVRDLHRLFRPDDQLVTEVFWPEDSFANSTVEREAMNAFRVMAQTLERAFQSFTICYYDAVEAEKFALQQSLPETTSDEERARQRRHREWIATVVDWIGDALARHYAFVHQEQRAWTQERKSGVWAKQRLSSFCGFMSGRCAPDGRNPFERSYTTHFKDRSLRSYSPYRELAREWLHHEDVSRVVEQAAVNQGCDYNRTIRKCFWTARQFEEGWPFLCAYLKQRCEAYNELVQLTEKDWKRSKHWKSILASKIKSYGDFNFWHRMIVQEAGGPWLNWEWADWSQVESNLLPMAEELLCGTRDRKAEWEHLWFYKEHQADPDAPLFVPSRSESGA
ncbi:MAG: hypothetical protein KDK99_08645 [Verrucomicrobiales bacterium]|nr:hypothetical protein [Verrucomicrobiales bacterium]